jgi:hypothetical protein
MNDKIVAGVLMALAGAMLVGILYVVFAGRDRGGRFHAGRPS